MPRQDQAVVIQDSLDKLSDQFNAAISRKAETEASKAQKLAQWNSFASGWNQGLHNLSKAIVDDSRVVDRLWPSFLSSSKKDEPGN